MEINKSAGKKILIILAAFLAVEALSFFGWRLSALNQAGFIILTLATLTLAVWRLEYGVLIVLAELFIGSLGHLFTLSIGGVSIPLRVALWAIVMTVFAIKFIRNFRQPEYWPRLRDFFNGWRRSVGQAALALAAFVLIGAINGLARGHSLFLIFSDFNNWLYFLLLLPLLAVYGGNDATASAARGRLKILFFSAALWLSLKTLALLFIFTHDSAIAPEIYTWLRRSLTGEMTPSGQSWPRIFMQGQVYAGIAFFFSFWLGQVNFRPRGFFKRNNLIYLAAAGIFFSAVLVSFSRSFWAGVLAALGLSLLAIGLSQSWRRMFSAALWSLVAGVLGFVFIYLVVAFPYVSFAPSRMSDSFLERINSGGEAAVASRWSLLPELWQEIRREPFLGQGYGATVTYFSRDPRVLQNSPSGEYTTYAFEWSYLEIWLKIGLLGLAAYLLFLWRLVSGARRLGTKTGNSLWFGLAAGLIFLAVTNIFTPYLNHPLGIGVLLLSSCLIYADRVYYQ